MNALHKDLNRFAAQIRIETIKALAEAGFGHIGGAMSIADVLAVLYGAVMHVDPTNPGMEERDWLVLSKGHSGPVLYATLALKGYFPMEHLKTINKPGTILPSHCDRNKTPGIDVTTGSLGQGISVAAGIAKGFKLRGKPNYIYVILGDGEMQEGQVWEGMQFVAHQRLDNLIVFIDNNKKQLDDYVENINRSYSIEDKLKAFGLYVQTIKGYDTGEILQAVEQAKQQKGAPSAIVLDTVKGYGCNFAQSEEKNHYMVISREMADSAVCEIEEIQLKNTTGGSKA
jgi:transketolase